MMSFWVDSFQQVPSLPADRLRQRSWWGWSRAKALLKG